MRIEPEETGTEIGMAQANHQGEGEMVPRIRIRITLFGKGNDCNHLEYSRLVVS